MEYLYTIEDKTEITGWHSILVMTDTGNSLSFIFEHTPTTDELKLIVNNISIVNEFNTYHTEEISLFDNIDLLKDFIRKIKETPNVTLTQYNTWLGTKQWYETAVIRYFVYRAAMILAEKYGIVLINLTETQVLQKLRDWIVATPNKIIAKILLNNLNID